MSHTVIITDSVVVPTPPGSLVAGSSTIEVTVKYTPSHDLSPQEQWQQQQRILKKIHQMPLGVPVTED